MLFYLLQILLKLFKISQTKSPILDEESIKEAFSKYFDCEFETIMYKLEFDNKKEFI